MFENTKKLYNQFILRNAKYRFAKITEMNDLCTT